MITRRFIEKVHDAFDELNYRETQQLDFDKFEQAAVRTLTHCKDLDDAKNAVGMYQFCLKQWDKIEKVFNKKLSVFNEYDYEGNSLISLVSDDDSFGTYYITNGINRKVKEVFVASSSFEEEMFAIDFSKGRFTIFEDGDYYMKYSKLSSVKMKLFDNDDNCLCNIVLSEELEIFLENNLTPYELVIYDHLVGIYDRDYIQSLNYTDKIDIDRLLAGIEWDIIGKSPDFGLAKLNVFADDQDVEMLLFFAASTFLVFQKYLQAQKTQTYAMMSFWASRR